MLNSHGNMIDKSTYMLYLYMCLHSMKKSLCFSRDFGKKTAKTRANSKMQK